MELNQKITDMKRKRADPLFHCEGDTEEEDISYNSDTDEDSSDCMLEPEPVRRKLPVRKGPTDRSHCSQQSTTPADFLPSDDEFDCELEAEDDDGAELTSWMQPKGRKSRAKKQLCGTGMMRLGYSQNSRSV